MKQWQNYSPIMGDVQNCSHMWEIFRKLNCNVSDVCFFLKVYILCDVYQRDFGDYG